MAVTIKKLNSLPFITVLTFLGIFQCSCVSVFESGINNHNLEVQLPLLDSHFQIDQNENSKNDEIIAADHEDEQEETEYFDLSYTYDNDTIFFPFQRWQQFQLLKDVNTNFSMTADGKRRYTFSAFSFCMSEHGGTHIDSPFHFNKFGWRLHEIPLKRLVDVPLVVVDVEQLVFSQSAPREFILKVEHLIQHELKYGRIPSGSVLFVRFGWSKFWPDKLRYMGWDNSTVPYGGSPTFSFPEVSRGAASWLLRERNIYGIGTDTMSPDTSDSNPYVHIMLLENQVYIVENVANLDYLLQKIRPNDSNRHCRDLRVHVIPIKTEGTGGPARLVAYCKKW